MYIFVDESGIHKAIEHSVFVLVYAEVENYNLMEERVKQVERKLGLEDAGSIGRKPSGK